MLHNKPPLLISLRRYNIKTYVLSQGSKEYETPLPPQFVGEEMERYWCYYWVIALGGFSEFMTQGQKAYGWIKHSAK